MYGIYHHFQGNLKFILYRLNIKNFPSERTVKTNFNLQKKNAQVKKPGYYSHNHR